jgi:hypothetical protein
VSHEGKLKLEFSDKPADPVHVYVLPRYPFDGWTPGCRYVVVPDGDGPNVKLIPERRKLAPRDVRDRN